MMVVLDRTGARRTGIVARLLLYTYMFYVIYAPPLGAGTTFLKFAILAATPLVFGLVYVFRGDTAVGRMLATKPVAPLLVYSFLGALYVSLVILVSNVMVESFDDLRIVQNTVICLMLINVVFIIDLLAKSGHDWLASFEVVLWLGALQGVISILGLLIPAVHDFSRSLYVMSGNSNEWVLKDRIYGIASDFTYGTQIYHATLAAAALYVMLVEKKMMLVRIVLVLAACLLNGRTGIVVFATMTIIILVLVFGSRGNLLGLLIGAGVLAGVGALAATLLEQFAPAVYQQILVSITNTDDLVNKGQATGTYSALVPELMRFPQGAGLLFGEGVRLYTGGEGNRTDIGFTNDLFAGGIVYLLLLYVPFIIFIFRALKGRKTLALALLAAAAIADLKGELFHSTPLLFVMTFVPLVMLYGAPRGTFSRPRNRRPDRLTSGVPRNSVESDQSPAASPSMA